MKRLFQDGAILTVRIDEQHKGALELEARRRGVKLSALARQLLTIEAKTHGDGASRQIETIAVHQS